MAAFTMTRFPQYMQQGPSPIMSGQRKGTSRTAPQSMSKLLEILGQMPQFQPTGASEQETRDLYGGAVGAARTFGMGEARARSGERGAAPVQREEGVEAQQRARLGLFTQAPMIEAIQRNRREKDAARNSYFAQLFSQLLQSASGPVSEASSEETSWRKPEPAEINPNMPMVKYPSQDGGGGGGQRPGTLGGSLLGGSLGASDFWKKPFDPYGRGGISGSEEDIKKSISGNFEQPYPGTMGGDEGRSRLGGPAIWPSTGIGEEAAGQPGEPGENTSSWYDPGGTGTSRGVSRKDYLANPGAFTGTFGAWK